MLSIKEKLLQQPWIEKKYKNHRKKVLSAHPAIDNKPPEIRNHVTIKQKKVQKEHERCSKIEKGNFLLLKKLCWIMKSNRVDNCWREPLPNFLNRVNIYDKSGRKNEKLRAENYYLRQNVKCFACTLYNDKHILTPEIPNERIPWEPQKRPLSLKFHEDETVTQNGTFSPPIVSVKKPTSTSQQKRISKSAPSLKKKNSTLNANVCSKMKTHQNKIEINRSQSVEVNDSSFKTVNKKTNSKIKPFENECPKYFNSIVINKGSLALSVNFPSGTSVKLKDGKNEKILVKAACGCKNDTKIC